jgi:glycosyltransferase involved in cell wall biosynthesis
MKITIIIPDASIRTFSRTKILYDLLKDSFELEVISIASWHDKDELYKKEFSEFKKIKYNLGTIISDLNKAVKGDLIYALRMKPTSLGFALSLKTQKKIPVIADIDADEIYDCYPYGNNKIKKFLFSLPTFNKPNSFVYIWLMQKRLRFTDDITISSWDLQKRYTGTFIPSTVDNEVYKPNIYKINEIKEYMEWQDSKIIFFSGTLDHHIQIKDVIQAIKLLNRNDIKLVIEGHNDGKDKIYKEDFICFISSQPELNKAKLISSSDIVIHPSDNTNLSLSNNIFEAIFSEKPIITTNSYDHEKLLDDNAYLYNNGDIKKISEYISFILNSDNFDSINSKSIKLRDLFIERYSKSKISDKLRDLINKVVIKGDK